MSRADSRQLTTRETNKQKNQTEIPVAAYCRREKFVVWVLPVKIKTSTLFREMHQNPETPPHNIHHVSNSKLLNMWRISEVWATLKATDNQWRAILSDMIQMLKLSEKDLKAGVPNLQAVELVPVCGLLGAGLHSESEWQESKRSFSVFAVTPQR